MFIVVVDLLLELRGVLGEVQVVVVALDLLLALRGTPSW